MLIDEVLDRLNALANPDKIELKKVRAGIVARNSLGIYHRDLDVLAKEIGMDSQLGDALFDTDIYEARLLCSKIFDPVDLTEGLMEKWVVTFENWEICDSFCMGFFVQSGLARQKAAAWSAREGEFNKRAAFAMMAAYGFANKEADNQVFEEFLIPVERESTDARLYVKKAVNWALRNIGKRNVDLQVAAIECARNIMAQTDKASGWIAKNALRELESPKANVLDYPRSIYRP